MAQEPIPQFRMKDLFIDVKLEACVNGTTFDFLGRKMFSTEFFRNSTGFGITSIDIEINTSLQPLVTVTFKDLYGATVFGSQKREADEDGQSIDYSILFNWPPPKFLFSFKGYLGKPATWVLNLKRTSTSFNSADGSYDIKCEFVPNQWGFFADMPFLYLLAAKRLRKDNLSITDDLPEDERRRRLRNVTSVFDLIKIGKRVEIQTQDTSKEFDEIRKQMGSIKSNVARAMIVTEILPKGETIKGEVNNQGIKGFSDLRIPKTSELEGLESVQRIEQNLGNPRTLSALNAFILLSIRYRDAGAEDVQAIEDLGGVAFGQTGFSKFGEGLSRNWGQFLKDFNDAGGRRVQIDEAVAGATQLINSNLEAIEDEIRRRVFNTSEKKLEKITIGEIFSQLAKDGAYVIGSVLDAGLEGYYRNFDTRVDQAGEGNIIGEAFPLVINEDGEEVPATSNNLKGVPDLGVDENEMRFVQNFISAVSEGISKDLLANNPQNGQDDSILKQRVNNMEIAEGNPYKSYYTNIATNVLIRGGIAGYFTRSDDPNLPGSYNEGFFGGARDDIQSIEELAERDMQNLTDSIIKNLSDVDFLLLQRFARFFNRYFTKDADAIANSDGSEGFPLDVNPNGGIISLITGAQSIQTISQAQAGPFNWKVVMTEPASTDEEQDNINNLAGTGNSIESINTSSEISFNGNTIPTDKQSLSAAGIETLNFQTIWNELYQPEILSNYQIENDQLIYEDIEEEESKREDQVGGEAPTETFDDNGGESQGVRNAQNPLSFIDPQSFTATRIINNGLLYTFPEGTTRAGSNFMVIFEGDSNKRATEANSAPTDSQFRNENKDAEDGGKNEPLGYVPINSKYGDEGDTTTELSNGRNMLWRVATVMDYRDGSTYGDGNPRTMFRHKGVKNPPDTIYGIGEKSPLSALEAIDDIIDTVIFNGAIKESPSDTPDLSSVSQEYALYTGNIGYTICTEQHEGQDSGLVWAMFLPTRQSRNQRAYIRKCAELIEEKIEGIIDERNQIVGEVLGKAGEQENLIYKQMHTLYHQWQSLAYSDKTDAAGCLIGDVQENKSVDSDEPVFNVAEVLEKRFGDNHLDLLNNEVVCFSKEQLAEGTNLTAEEIQSLKPANADESLYCLSISNKDHASGVPDGTFIYDYPLQRIAGTGQPVNVRDSIINLEPLYKPNANTTILNIIQQVCTKNNFLFIPIPGNPGYLNVKDIYSPSREPANIQIRNFFHVLFTPTPESRSKTKNADGTPLSLSENHRTYNANSFVIKFGSPDNQIVSNLQVGTDDNKVTAESIVNLQRLVDNENQNKKVTTDCSMLPVLAGRSYTASVDMLGNSQAYPMQFFYLENSPLFGGLYQVMKVKHQIDPNNMTTSLEGIRMRFASDSYGGIRPITLQTFRDLGEVEAPNTLYNNFDEALRERNAQYARKIPSPGSATGRFTSGPGDYLGQTFVDGLNGGPVSQPVDLLPQNVIDNISDDFLGQRSMYSAGQVISQETVYIFDRYPITAQVLSAYKAMQDAAFADGVDLHLSSGYRDPFETLKRANGSHISSSQYSLRVANVIDKSKKDDDNFLRTASSTAFDPYTARPGYSNHNSGLAIDLNCGGAKFNNFDQGIYEWLLLNAYKYGFVRTVSTEEWHWEYRPGTPMFGFSNKMNRDHNKWYDLPDKLGIPIDKPTEESVAQAGEKSVESRGNYAVYIVDGSGQEVGKNTVTYDESNEFVITVPNSSVSLEAGIFISGLEGNANAPQSGYRADVANGAPVSLSESRVMVYANRNSSVGVATTAMNGLLNNIGKTAVVRSVILYSDGGKIASSSYSPSLRFFGLCDPVASKNNQYQWDSANYGSNTVLDTRKSNWSYNASNKTPESYGSIDDLIAKVSSANGEVVENNNTAHSDYPSYFLQTYQDRI